MESSMATRFDPPNIPSDSILCISAAIVIQCPASHAFDMLLDTENWPRWNSFCPKVDVIRAKSGAGATGLEMGDRIILHVRMTPESALREQKEQVVELEDPRSGPNIAAHTSTTFRVCWNSEGVPIPRFMLRANRVNEFRDGPSATGGAQCEYRTWESMAGPMARVVKGMYQETLQRRFQDWAQDLKSYAEATWKEKQSSSVEG